MSSHDKTVQPSERWTPRLLAALAAAPLVISALLIALVIKGLWILLEISSALEPPSDGPSLSLLAFGTAKIVFLGLVIATPIGAGVAMYLSEFSSGRARRVTKPVLELLSAVPTVVWGYFALLVLTPSLSAFVPGLPRLNGLSAAIAVAFMVIPTFATLADDALVSVPSSVREGAYALGADRVATLLRVVLPSAAWGLLSALLLSISRAVGESMIVLIAAGYANQWSLDPRAPVLTLPAFVAEFGLADLARGNTPLESVFVATSLLVLLTSVLSLAGYSFTRRRARARSS